MELTVQLYSVLFFRGCSATGSKIVAALSAKSRTRLVWFTIVNCITGSME